jgi:hypothetical protein
MISLSIIGMGLDLNFIPGEIQRIEIDANNTDTQDPGALATAWGV